MLYDNFALISIVLTFRNENEPPETIPHRQKKDRMWGRPKPSRGFLGAPTEKEWASFIFTAWVDHLSPFRNLFRVFIVELPIKKKTPRKRLNNGVRGWEEEKKQLPRFISSRKRDSARGIREHGPEVVSKAHFITLIFFSSRKLNT